MNNQRIIDEKRRGRGATFNETNRFETQKREEFHDGWDMEEELVPLKTELILDSSRSILARNSSPDIPFDRSINPYRGCEHGCIYCFARPSHAYLGYSPGLDFESKILYKPHAVELLAEALSKASYRPAPIAFGTNTDPYQPVEKQLKITRGLISYLLERRHPLTIVTKGSLITRDLDILSELAKLNLVHVMISVTTLDNQLHRKLEPRASAPASRLRTIEALSKAGIPVGVLAAPMIPKINDHELENILSACKNAGAISCAYILVRLPLEVAPLFRDWLEVNYPARAAMVMRIIQETRGGKDNDSTFGKRMRGSGIYADLLSARAKAAKLKLGYENHAIKLRTDLFRPPPKDKRQMELF